MVIVAYLAPLIAVAGLVLYLAATAPKLVRVGEIMFAAGLLATLLVLAGGHVVRLP